VQRRLHKGAEPQVFPMICACVARSTSHTRESSCPRAALTAGGLVHSGRRVDMQSVPPRTARIQNVSACRDGAS
jgi:hypothetical protein